MNILIYTSTIGCCLTNQCSNNISSQQIPLIFGLLELY